MSCGVSLRPGIGSPMPLIQPRPPGCSLASTLADARRVASVPAPVGLASRRITPDVVDPIPECRTGKHLRNLFAVVSRLRVGRENGLETASPGQPGGRVFVQG